MAKTKTPRPSKKRVTVTGTVMGAIEGAFSELADLKQELSDWKDSLEEKFSGTDKYATLETSIDALEFADDVPELPGDCGDFQITYVENQTKNLSRAKRRDNATSALDAAIEGIREWAEALREKAREAEEKHEADKAQDDEPEVDEDFEEIDENEADEAEQLADELEGQKDEADGAEFPGMYG